MAALHKAAATTFKDIGNLTYGVLAAVFAPFNYISEEHYANNSKTQEQKAYHQQEAKKYFKETAFNIVTAEVGGELFGKFGKAFGAAAPLLEGFESGGTKLISSAMLEKYPTSTTFGNPVNPFIAPTDQVNSLLSQGLTRKVIAERLGINDPLFLKGDLIRVDIKPSALQDLGLRPPTGNEGGANSLFIPGGKTIGGVTEGVVSSIPKSAPGVSSTVIKQ